MSSHPLTPSVFVVLTIWAALAGFSGAARAEAIRASDCMRDFYSWIEWSPTVWPLLGLESPSPLNQELGTRWRQRLSWHRVATDKLKEATEWGLAACDEEGFRYRSTSVQLQEAFLTWHESPSTRDFKPYFWAITQIESQSRYQKRLSQEVVSVFWRNVSRLGFEVIRPLAPEIRTALHAILTRDFPSVGEYTTIDHGTARIASGRLEIRVWPAPMNLLFALFHEAAHLNPMQTLHYKQWLLQRSPESWFELAMVEEYRARSLTLIFESAWKAHFPQYGRAESVPSLRTIWNQLRNQYKFNDPDERRAAEMAFAAWDQIPVTEQERRLEQWLSSR